MIVDAAHVVAFAAIAAGGSFLLFPDRGLIFSGTGTFRMVASTVISMSVSAWLASCFYPCRSPRAGPAYATFLLDDREAAVVRRFIGQVVALGTASWTVIFTNVADPPTERRAWEVPVCPPGQRTKNGLPAPNKNCQ